MDELRCAQGRREGPARPAGGPTYFQLPPQEDWFALRDVNEMDGATVGDGLVLFKQLFSGPRETVTERGMAIAAENARFNLGDVYRTINVPTFALRFLRPQSRRSPTRRPARSASRTRIRGWSRMRKTEVRRSARRGRGATSEHTGASGSSRSRASRSAPR
jgi:hypothetical protein